MLEDLRGVERAIREMAKKIADRARQVFDRRQTGRADPGGLPAKPKAAAGARRSQ